MSSFKLSNIITQAFKQTCKGFRSHAATPAKNYKLLALVLRNHIQKLRKLFRNKIQAFPESIFPAPFMIKLANNSPFLVAEQRNINSSRNSSFFKFLGRSYIYENIISFQGCLNSYGFHETIILYNQLYSLR